MKKKLAGFTIVELLIVIVVISILAAISVVAYNGIQSRARASQQNAAAKSYITIFNSYLAANGSYPSTGGQVRICLGIDVVNCTSSTSAWHRNTNLENSLLTIAGNLPTANTSIPNVSTPKMAYVPMSDITLNGIITPFLIYNVEAPNTCSVSNLVSGTWPNYSSSVPAQGYTGAENSGVRVCVIALPRP